MIQKIVENIEKVIIGKRESILLVIISLISGGHVLIEDVPGVGKTRLIAALAKSIDASFNRIQFTADVLPSDVTGFSVFNQKTGEFEFKKGAVMSQLLLADEINRTSPKTQAALLEVMEEQTVTVDGVTHQVPQPFMVLATQNPIEFSGTFPLPEAQLDRFFIKLSIGYPTAEDELSIMAMHKEHDPLEDLKAVASAEDIVQIQKSVRAVHIAKNVGEYIVKLVSATRNFKGVDMGASPRASVALLRASQAKAFLSGRSFVLPDDVQYMAKFVLAHRIMLSAESKFRGISEEAVIAEIIRTTDIPEVS